MRTRHAHGALPNLPPSPFCVQRILQLNRKVDDPTLQRLLRVSVEPGGCSGFQYRFELEEPSNVEADDAYAHAGVATHPPRHPGRARACSLRLAAPPCSSLPAGHGASPERLRVAP